MEAINEHYHAPLSPKRWYFAFFLVSGFCSILYEMVWVRIAMAQFGVTTAIVSMVLSVFMGGLGLGSWGAGVLVRRLAIWPQFSALKFYALMEFLIGISALAVPYQLLWGRELLLKNTAVISAASFLYYLASGIWLVITMLPWCACMGATFPFAMSAARQDCDPEAVKSFSYLYLANILGATAGTVISLGLIELLGFRHTLSFGLALNLLLAATSFALSLGTMPTSAVKERNALESGMQHKSHCGRTLLWLLFATGLTSMGAELVWVRLYTPSLSTTVYSFAVILGTYLLATFLGTRAYRRGTDDRVLESGLLWIALGTSVLISFPAADPRFPLPSILRVVLGIMPFSGLVGFITPAMVDRFSRGDASRAGSAYATNIVGCILGPLLSSFVLLPLIGERLALATLALPWFVVGLRYQPKFVPFLRNVAEFLYFGGYWALVLGSLALAFLAKGLEEQYQYRQVKRDSTATVIATGLVGTHQRLLVNGIGITELTPITKMMVHLPVAFLPRQPHTGLVICFGMGTSHLSMLSWGVHSTAVELVPSVPTLVSFFHPNTSKMMESPLSRVVIDDGRSYLERSSEQYDVITIDPPPPVEAAGSSLLYSEEFYAIAKRHLRAGGILQQWFPGTEPDVIASVARSLSESFPYIRAFRGMYDYGIHFLASTSPIPDLSASDLAAKLPPSAVRDLLEWGPSSNPKQQFELVLNHELSVVALMEAAPGVLALRDDRPINEYFILRRHGHWILRTVLILNTIALFIFGTIRLGLKVLPRLLKARVNAAR